MPSVRLEALADVVGERQLGRAVDRDAVVVVHDVEPSETEVAGERRRLVAHPLHQAAVAGDRPDVVVDQLAAEAITQHTFGHRHADGVAEPLTEWAGRHLDAHGVAGLGMSRRAAAERTERPQVVELEAVPAEVQHRVLQDRRVPVGQDEAVAVRPGGVERVVAHHPAVEHVGQRGEGHRRALMAALGVQGGVHREAADHRDRLGLDVGGERRRGSGSHRGGPYPSPLGAKPPSVSRVGASVNGTTVHGPRSTRQWANTWP